MVKDFIAKHPHLIVWPITILLIIGAYVLYYSSLCCPSCSSTNLEKMYERIEYRRYVTGYKCEECGYNFEH